MSTHVLVTAEAIKKLSAPKIVGNHVESAHPLFDRAEFKDETDTWEIPISYSDSTEEIVILAKDDYSPMYLLS
jgi:hypothetical protein